MTGDAAALYWEVGWFSVAVTYLTLPLLILSRVIQLFSTYIVVAAAVDRWLLVYSGTHHLPPPFSTTEEGWRVAEGRNKWVCRTRRWATTPRNRYVIIGAIGVLSVLLRVPFVFSVEYKVYGDCPELMGSIGIEPTPFSGLPLPLSFSFWGTEGRERVQGTTPTTSTTSTSSPSSASSSPSRSSSPSTSSSSLASSSARTHTPNTFAYPFPAFFPSS